jgi:hypothetical protein
MSDITALKPFGDALKMALSAGKRIVYYIRGNDTLSIRWR